MHVMAPSGELSNNFQRFPREVGNLFLLTDFQLFAVSCCIHLHTCIYRYVGVWRWQKMTSVRFCKKLFSVRFRFYKINLGFGFSVRFLHCVLFNVYALTWMLSSLLFYHCFVCLYVMTLEMTYFRAPCWIGPTNCQSKLLRTKSADTAWRKILWLLILSCWKMNCEWDNVKNHPQTAEVGFWNENRTTETEFSVFEFWVRCGF